ncbi:hypothetical protein [Pseudorhodobacter sp. MZDSW-24AT]|uniref:hypothetical protein n=1 Tax=Pseudorhodobacter sp. MZDSW-24AT TaxID=2052957 RepID=UPI0012FE5E55|nr:hypothetical protein [Pseudorhodobacter sp. MZDSW-24AT]
MPHFIPDNVYSGLLADLRAAAISPDWHSALAEVLAGADVLPEVCRADFVEEGERMMAA